MIRRVPGLYVIVSALAAGACTLGQTEPGDLMGPSTFATSVNVTANPDVINLGQSMAAPGESTLIVVRVLDEKGQPKPGVTLRLDTSVDGVMEDCGELQMRTLVTDASGFASTLFTAPGTPVPLPECTGFIAGDTVTIHAFVVGTNAQVFTGSTASVRMMSPTFLTPIGGLSVNFTISPNPAKVNTPVTFSDAGSSSPGHTIPNSGYRWTFSDGTSELGPTVIHDFGSPGDYNVTLTVTDDIGQTAFKSASVTITN
jgi:hypothetical protein